MVRTQSQKSKRVNATADSSLSRAEPLESSVSKNDGNRALKNIGNSCYMNSTFQALSGLDQFTNRFRQIHLYLMEVEKEDMGRMSEEGKELVKLIYLSCEVLYTLSATCRNSGGKSAPVEEKILKDIRKIVGSQYPEFNNEHMQDANEFLLLFLDQLETLLKNIALMFYRFDFKEPEMTPHHIRLIMESYLIKMCPTNTFRFKCQTQLTCSKCSYRRTTKSDSRLDLSLSIGAEKNIQGMLYKAFEPEYNEDLICAECGSKGAMISSRIINFPESFAISVKRYTISDGNLTIKSNATVHAPKLLYTSKIAEFRNDNVKEMKNEQKEKEEKSGIERKEGSEDDVECVRKVLNESMTLNEGEKEREDTIQLDTTLETVSSFSNSTTDNSEGNIEKVRGILDDSHSRIVKSRNSSTILIESTLHSSENFSNSLRKPTHNSTANSSSLMVVDENIYSTILFEPLSDASRIREILEEVGIVIDDGDLESHLNRFSRGSSEVEVEEMPRLIQRVAGDGNCFYRSISYLLTGSETWHGMLRQKMVQLMSSNASVFASMTSESIDSLINKSKREGEWASELNIIAMCSLLRTDIFTYINGKWVRYQPRAITGEKRTGSLFLNNKESVHFEPVISIRPLTGSTKRPASKNEKDGVAKRRADGRILGGSREVGEEELYGIEKKIGEKAGNEAGNRSIGVMKEIDWEEAGKSPVYSLSSVICHHGSNVHTGHYVAYTRNGSNGKWMYCSDEVVYPVSEQSALLESAKSGYVFFYQKVVL